MPYVIITTATRFIRGMTIAPVDGENYISSIHSLVEVAEGFDVGGTGSPSGYWILDVDDVTKIPATEEQVDIAFTRHLEEPYLTQRNLINSLIAQIDVGLANIDTATFEQYKNWSKNFYTDLRAHLEQWKEIYKDEIARP